MRVPGRSLVLRVAGQHALQAHADALDVLHRTPAGGAEEVEADDAVAVDVWMHGDGAGRRGRGRGKGRGGGGGGGGGGAGDEHDFGRFDGVFVGEAEAEPVGGVGVDGV